jgi:hypothetical protein
MGKNVASTNEYFELLNIGKRINCLNLHLFHFLP